MATLAEQPAAKLKRSRASLVGGIATGIGVAILAVLVSGGPSPQSLVLGACIGAAVGVWVRLADL
jgi:hypothetical protein